MYDWACSFSSFVSVYIYHKSFLLLPCNQHLYFVVLARSQCSSCKFPGRQYTPPFNRRLESFWKFCSFSVDWDCVLERSIRIFLCLKGDFLFEKLWVSIPTKWRWLVQSTSCFVESTVCFVESTVCFQTVVGIRDTAVGIQRWRKLQLLVS